MQITQSTQSTVKQRSQKISPIFLILFLITIILFLSSFIDILSNKTSFIIEPEVNFIQKTPMVIASENTKEPFLIKDSLGYFTNDFKNELQRKANFNLSIISSKKFEIKRNISQISYNQKDFFNALYFENEPLNYKIYENHTKLKSFILDSDFHEDLHPQQYWQLIKMLEYQIYQETLFPLFYQYSKKTKFDPQIILSNFNSAQLAVIHYYLYKGFSYPALFEAMIRYSNSDRKNEDKWKFLKIFPKEKMSPEQYIKTTSLFMNEKIFGYLIGKDVVPTYVEKIMNPLIDNFEWKPNYQDLIYPKSFPLNHFEKNTKKIEVLPTVPQSYIMGA